ncbi:MAG: ABC transporter ATP-binding protein [Sporichthyaceae bacterium]
MSRLPIATASLAWRAIVRMSTEHRRLALGAAITLIAATGLSLITAPVLGHIVDLVLEERPAGELSAPLSVLAVVAVGYAALSALGLVLVARFGEELLARLREEFVARALGLPLEQIEAAGSGDLTSRVTNDVTVISEGIRDALPEFLRAGLTIAGTVAGLAVLDWRFALAALLAAPVQILTVRAYLREAGPLYASQRVAAGDLQQQLLDSISGSRTVRAFGLAAARTAEVKARSQHTVELALRGVRLQTRFFGRLNLAEFVGLSAVLITGFLLVRADQVSVGTASAAALYFANLFNPINIALALIDEAQAAAASLARLVGVIDLPSPEVPAPAARVSARGVSERSAPAAIEVRALSFAYTAGHQVLHEIDLTVAAGERVALVGTSGAGKSTLAKLIAGVHTADAGAILLDGQDVRAPAAGGVRARVALITQEVHVFAGTLAADLRLARPGADDAALTGALAAVGADWVNLLPQALATEVGEGGRRLTVAQAQHLALARLVLADPPVAILDEATAEAGSAGARILELAADAALAGRTALVVAHRLTQAATADRVVVLRDGRIAEIGTHSELVTAGGPYARLWSAWSARR